MERGTRGRGGGELQFPQTTADRRLAETGGSSEHLGVGRPPPRLFLTEGTLSKCCCVTEGFSSSCWSSSPCPSARGAWLALPQHAAETLLESELILSDWPAKGDGQEVEQSTNTMLL